METNRLPPSDVSLIKVYHTTSGMKPDKLNRYFLAMDKLKKVQQFTLGGG